ncbi:MAG: hypothetical protein DRI46_13690 [Chloroflexi bacterium]|nr:MAG: hypothetical protein DRI46_13690 [Chloroflexota bacterium]
MGSLFDKTKVYLATSTAKLFREDNDPVNDAALGAVLNNESIPNYIQATGLSGPGTTIRNYMNYGRSTYVHGLPELRLYAEWAKNPGVPDPEVPITIISYDPAYKDQLKELEIYPMVPLKKDGIYTYDLDKSTDEYITPRRILRKVSTRIENLDALLKENPEAAKVDDCYFAFSLDIYTQVEDSIGYLHTYFNKLATISPVTRTGFEASLIDSETSSKGPVRNIFEVIEGESKFKFTYDYITSETVSANMDDGVTYASSFTFAPHEEYPLGGADDQVIYRVEKTTASFRERHNNNPDQAFQITIHGIIFETYASALGKKDTMLKYLHPSFVGLLPEDPLAGTSGIYIPLSHDVLPKFTVLHRHRILSDAMLLTFVAADEVDLEWYQTGIVKIIIMAVAFYLIATGIGGGVKALAAMSAKTFIINAVVAIGLSFLVELIISKVDGVAGIILSFAAIIAAGKITGMTGGFSTMPLGSQSLQILNAVGFVANKYTTVDAKELAEQIIEQKEKQDIETAELQEMLVKNPGIDQDFLNLIINAVRSPPTESASTYQSRTLDLSMVLDFSINQAENYLENMLTLPEPNFSPKYA